jgi:GNAT superfamily N-acetyltransferase
MQVEIPARQRTKVHCFLEMQALAVSVSAQTVIVLTCIMHRMNTVPIRSLGKTHRDRIAQHLLSLSPHDRYLRFGYSAKDEHIKQYVAKLDFDRDEIFGIYNRKLLLIATAHLACTGDKFGQPLAEFGVSVLSEARGKGYGTLLFERAIKHARNRGIESMLIHALSENAAMLKIASKAGARVQKEGPNCEAYLRLPKATLDTRFSEMIEAQVAKKDYQFKVFSRQFFCLTGNDQ